MSEENARVVRRLYDAVSSGQEVPRELFASEVELDLRDTAPDFTVIHGIDASLQALGGYWEMFEDFHIEVGEVIQADQDHVVVAIRDVGRIRGTDAVVRNGYFNVWTFSGGKIVRLSTHMQRERALVAAGMFE